jgi:transposase InsO family protein
VRVPFQTSSTERDFKPLELIVPDVRGKMAVPMHNGREYFAPFIDVKTRYLWATVITRKSDVRERFRAIHARAELQTGYKVASLRTDGGGEYTSTEFGAEVCEAGVEYQVTEADSSASKGIAECAICFLSEIERTMRVEAGLPPQFWGYVIAHAAEILNSTAKKALGA